MAMAVWPMRASGPVRRLAWRALKAIQARPKVQDAEADACAGGDAEVDAHLRRGAVDECGQPED